MVARPTETLQNYLDNLLFDEGPCDDALDRDPLDRNPLDRAPTNSKLPTERQPKAIHSECSKAAETSTDLEIQLYLAEEKKRQLQKMLMPISIIEDAVVTSPVNSESINQAHQKPIFSSPSVPISTEALSAENTPQVHAELESMSTSAVNHIENFLTWNENGRPLWAQHKFDALLFEVAGLALAVPLIALGQIVKMSSCELTPLFGRSEWFMGLLTTESGQIRVINTALFVMSERYKTSFIKSTQYVISMDGQPWGLAVDSVMQPITLDPEDVKWRSERTSRPWLAGTVKSKMCALIDIPQMAKLLNAPNNELP